MRAASRTRTVSGALGEFTPDVIISDLSMLEFSGYRALGSRAA
jgi:hypothetical protein